MNDRFVFTVVDLARFLGKSPVTVRQWEAKGLIEYPRDSGGDRKFNCECVRGVVEFAARTGRITINRQRKIEAAMTILEELEREGRNHRPGRSGQVGVRGGAAALPARPGEDPRRLRGGHRAGV